MEKERLIVIGGDAAGMSAASKAKREDPDLDVLVFEKQEYVSFGLCGLPYYISGEVEKLDDLIAMDPKAFQEKRGIDVRTEHEVLDIHPEERSVVLENEEGEKLERSYDKLLIATGAYAIIPPLKNVGLENIFTLHWLDDGKEIKKYVESKKPDRVVLTAGYIGLEMAEAFGKLGLDVTVLAKDEKVLPMIDEEIAETVKEELEKNNVDFKKNSEITGFEGDKDGKVRKVKTKNGEVETDFVLLGVGVKPSSELAEKAGIEIGKTGGILVDEKMETNIKNIYAAGDCVESRHILTGEGVNIPLGDTANRQGRTAGINISGGNATFLGILGTAITKIFDLAVARTGLSENEAKKSEFDYTSVKIDAPSRAFYYPGGSKITVKMIIEENSGRLLGTQMAGKEGVSQRIDVAASLINYKSTIEEIQNLDLAYAPPYSPAWDPLQTAAKVASSKIGSD